MILFCLTYFSLSQTSCNDDDGEDEAGAHEKQLHASVTSDLHHHVQNDVEIMTSSSSQIKRMLHMMREAEEGEYEEEEADGAMYKEACGVAAPLPPPLPGPSASLGRYFGPFPARVPPPASR